MTMDTERNERLDFENVLCDVKFIEEYLDSLGTYYIIRTSTAGEWISSDNVVEVEA